MTWPPNANFTTRASRDWQEPVYFVRLGGIGDTELITDEDLEDWTTATDLTSWTENLGTGGSVDREATIIYRGLFSAKITQGTAGNAGLTQNGITLKPNTAYRLTARVRGGATGRRSAFRLQNQTTANFLQADGTWAATEANPSVDVGDTTTWKQFSIIFTTESTGTLFDLDYLLTTAGGTGYLNGEFVYLGLVSIVQNSDFSTGPVREADVHKLDYMDIPEFSAAGGDPIEGTFTPQTADIKLLDVDGVITKLISTEKDDPVVVSMINRRATVFAGYRDLEEKNYVEIFSGRIMNLSLRNRVYSLQIADALWLLDKEVMENASDGVFDFAKLDGGGVVTVEGNIVNIYWAFLSGIFDTAHADFPLKTVSVAGGTTPDLTAAPTGLGIARADIDEQLLKDQRDVWHDDTEGEVVLHAPLLPREYLEIELFRVFQCYPAIGGDGRIGLRFWNANVAVQTPFEVVEPEVVSWERRYDLHMNRFIIEGDWDVIDGEYDAVLYSLETQADLDSQSETEQIIELRLKSQWLTTALNGAALAQELAGRMRVRVLETPAEVVIRIPFNENARNFQLGEVIELTDADLPDLLFGTVGLQARTMTIIQIRTIASEGMIEMKVQDTGYTRAAGWGPVGVQSDYDSQTPNEQEEYVSVGDTNGRLGAADDRGYVWL